MPYNSDLTRLKEILEITDTESDAELNNDLAAAYAEVNSVLKFHGFTVPLSSPPDDVKETENYWAASYFQERRNLPIAEKFYKRGQTFLQAYIQAEKYKPTFLRV